MSSTLLSRHSTCNVSNMMFWRVVDFAAEVGALVAPDDEHHGWAATLVGRLQPFGYTPDISVTEFVSSAAEADFWAQACGEVAERIYRRALGNQEDQTWQASTIWAAYDFARVFRAAVSDYDTGSE